MMQRFLVTKGRGWDDMERFEGTHTWFVCPPCPTGCEHAHRFIEDDTRRFKSWKGAMMHVEWAIKQRARHL